MRLFSWKNDDKTSKENGSAEDLKRRKNKLKASGYMTVEGALIMSMCLVIFFAVIFKGFDMYHDSYDHVKGISTASMNAVGRFRTLTAVTDAVEDVK